MFKFFDIAGSNFSAESSGGEAEVTTADLREVGEENGVDVSAAELWAHYGLAYRPPASAGKNRCQALAVPIAGGRAVIATRDARSSEAAGALNDGDVALWSVGKNAVRVNADGSIALIQQGASTDAMIAIQKNGSIVLSNQWGQIELGPKGFLVVTADGCSLKAGQAQCQMLAPQCFVTGGVVGLGVAPAAPLTLQPLTGVTKPAPNIFI